MKPGQRQSQKMSMIHGSAATSAEADCTADPSGHMKQHALAGEGGGRHTEYYKTVTRTVEHPAEYGTRYVVDTPAWTETVSDGIFLYWSGAKK